MKKIVGIGIELLLFFDDDLVLFFNNFLLVDYDIVIFYLLRISVDYIEGRYQKILYGKSVYNIDIFVRIKEVFEYWCEEINEFLVVSWIVFIFFLEKEDFFLMMLIGMLDIFIENFNGDKVDKYDNYKFFLFEYELKVFKGN